VRGAIASAVLVALLGGACAGDAGGGATVELDIYSGRPNPVWRIDDAGGAAVVTRWEALPAATPIPPR